MTTANRPEQIAPVRPSAARRLRAHYRRFAGGYQILSIMLLSFLIWAVFSVK